MDIISVAAAVAGLISLTYQMIDGIIKLKTFFGEVSRSQKTVLEFLYDIECLNRTLEDVRGLLSNIRNHTISRSDVFVATLEIYLMECSTDIKEWIKVAEKIDPASKNGAEAFFKRFRVAVDKRGISDLGGRVTTHQLKIGTSLSVLGRSLDVLTLEGVLDVSSKIDRMAKSQSGSARISAAKIDRMGEKFADELETLSQSTSHLSMNLDRIETSSNVSMENSVHSANTLNSVSSMVSQILSTVSKLDSAISSGHHDVPTAKMESGNTADSTVSKRDSAISPGHHEVPTAKIGSGDKVGCSENTTSAAVASTEEKWEAVAGNTTYRCYYPRCDQSGKRYPDFGELRGHMSTLHRPEPEEFALLKRLAPGDAQVWTCNALLGIEDAFNIDRCGYCAERFQPNPPDWDVRGRHLVTKHGFDRCSTNIEEYSSLDFGEHLRHIHHAETNSLTNTVFMRKFFTADSERVYETFSERSSQPASNYSVDVPEEPVEVTALFQVQIKLLLEEFKQTQRSENNSTKLLQNDVRSDIQSESQLQKLQIRATRIQEQFIVDGHSFDALNMSLDLKSCSRVRDLPGYFKGQSEIERVNLIDIIAGKDLLGKGKNTRDRISWWLLHILRLSKTATTLIRDALGIYDLKESSENSWIHSMLEHWSSDEAATNHEWPLMLSDGAVNSRDEDPHLMSRLSTRLLESQPVASAIDSFLFKSKIPETSALRNIEYNKAAIMLEFVKASGLCDTAVKPSRTVPLDTLMIRDRQERELQAYKNDKIHKIRSQEDNIH